MNNNIQITFGFLLLVGMLSCAEPRKAEVSKESKPAASALPASTTPPASTTESKGADADPYFVETVGNTSSVGPASITRNIIQDRAGNMWFATWEGIIRYNGRSFTNFTNQEDLQRFHVFNAMEDRNGNIWFGTVGAGVYKYNPSASTEKGEKSFTHFTTEDGLASNQSGWIYEDKAGNIWFGTYGGISIYDGTSFRNLTTADGLLDNDINAIVEDNNGTFWIGTRGKACTYDGTIFTEIKNDVGDSFVNTRSIIKDRNGNMWLGGGNGLWRYDGQAWTNFSTNFVGYIYEDSKGSIWTSSVSDDPSIWNIYRYDAPFFAFTKPTLIRTDERMFFGIAEDKLGNIWFGSLQGACRYDGTTFNYFR